MIARAVNTVCHIITKLELGGAQEVALYVVSHLDPEKYQARLISGPGGLLTEDARRLPHVDVTILSALGRQIHLFDDLAALIGLIKILRRLRPAVVHTHSSKAGILGRWAAWLAGVPVIVHTIHGYGITPAQPRWLQRLLVWLEQVTGWITTHWIAVSQADLEKGRTWGLFMDNVSLVRPGIDPEPFQQPHAGAAREQIRTALGISATATLVGTVACLKPQKAPEDFVAVAKRVVEARADVRFLLIGDGELRPRVEALIARQGLEGRVRLLGWRRDVADMMQAMDAFLLTSHWEGLPRVLLEARASGLPIVATDVGGAAEVVTGEPIGRLCPVGDVESLAQAVLQVLAQREGSTASAARPTGSLAEEFHIRETVKRYERLYDRLLEKRRNRSIPHQADAPRSRDHGAVVR